MAKIKIIHDKLGETLTIFFEEPSTKQICEELDNGIILIKNKDDNRIIGFEKLYYKPTNSDKLILESQIVNEG